MLLFQILLRLVRQLLFERVTQVASQAEDPLAFRRNMTSETYDFLDNKLTCPCANSNRNRNLIVVVLEVACDGIYSTVRNLVSSCASTSVSNKKLKYLGCVVILAITS